MIVSLGLRSLFYPSFRTLSFICSSSSSIFLFQLNLVSYFSPASVFLSLLFLALLFLPENCPQMRQTARFPLPLFPPVSPFAILEGPSAREGQRVPVDAPLNFFSDIPFLSRVFSYWDVAPFQVVPTPRVTQPASTISLQFPFPRNFPPPLYSSQKLWVNRQNSLSFLCSPPPLKRLQLDSFTRNIYSFVPISPEEFFLFSFGRKILIFFSLYRR